MQELSEKNKMTIPPPISLNRMNQGMLLSPTREECKLAVPLEENKYMESVMPTEESLNQINNVSLSGKTTRSQAEDLGLKFTYSQMRGLPQSSLSYFSKLGVISSEPTTSSMLSHSGIETSLGKNEKALTQIVKMIPSTNKEELQVAFDTYIQNGGDINSKLREGWTVLHHAAHMGRRFIVKLILEKYKARVSEKNSEGLTPLHVAACRGHLEIVKLLHKFGKADIDDIAGETGTALHCAAREGHIPLVSYLLISKAKIDLLNSKKQKAIDVTTNEKIIFMLDQYAKHASEKTEERKYLCIEEFYGMKIRPGLSHNGFFVPPRPPIVKGYLNISISENTIGLEFNVI